MDRLSRKLINATARGYFHCVSRCVRNAYLCGIDPVTGQSLQHRRQWIDDRLVVLTDTFAIRVYAYAVMSNQLHIVAYVDPEVAAAWSVDEVAER